MIRCPRCGFRLASVECLFSARHRVVIVDDPPPGGETDRDAVERWWAEHGRPTTASGWIKLYQQPPGSDPGWIKLYQQPPGLDPGDQSPTTATEGNHARPDSPPRREHPDR